jgi:hypothetical protein
MSTQLSDDEIRKKAVEKVKAKKGFFTHLAVYVVVNGFLWFIWATTVAQSMWSGGWGMRDGGWYPWPIWPMAGWGIALILHALTVFSFVGNWEENEVEKEIARMKKTGGPGQ